MQINEGLREISKELETRRPVLQILGLHSQRPKKELPEAKQPKQLPEKTGE